MFAYLVKISMAKVYFLRDKMFVRMFKTAKLIKVCQEIHRINYWCRSSNVNCISIVESQCNSKHLN